jgi:hypothetical protein
VLGALVASPAAASSSLTRLLARYQPVAVLEPTELFRPTAVEGFLAASALEQRTADGRWLAVPPPAALPTTEPGPWRLNVQNCSPAVGLASLSCYALLNMTSRVVYGRALRKRARIVLQYWFFYGYNLWSPRLPPDEFIWRTHEGDWEVVSVVLSRAEKPLFVGYSQHCTGERRAWARVPKWRRTQRPVAYVALGSHGNHFSPGAQRVDLRCWPQAARVIFRVHGVTARDFTGRGPALGPAGTGTERTQLVPVDSGTPPWMRFPGSWGEQGFFHAPEPVGTVAFGGGPAGPAFHAVWKEPLKTLQTWPPG